MNQVHLIQKKRDGHELTDRELDFLISGYVSEEIPEYQISALLMAIYFQGMTPKETATLTRVMRDSGIVLNHSAISGFKVDKHSTGGVGDKVSLILAPLIASTGLYVPMISGRALAHTGGTLDKLEAIPGFRTNLSLDELETGLEKVGAVLVGQTADLTPADKKLYALRDATATVNSIPLITASILSKKMAEGIDALVLDVKAGSGAIFEEKDKAWELARMLVGTATHFDLPTTAIVTNMEQPLGNAIGNWLETKEAIETLQGNGPADLVELTFTLSAQMLVLGKKVETVAEGFDVLQEKIASGEAFDKFLEIVELHGGDTSVVKNPQSYPTSEFKFEVKSEKNGYVAGLHSREIGVTSMALGAGRASVADGIDYTCGILLHKKVGDSVAEGEVVATAYSNSQDRLEANKAHLLSAITISEEKPPIEPLIYARIDASGEAKWDSERKAFG